MWRLFKCYAECHYAECRYSECRYAESRSTSHFLVLASAEFIAYLAW
jgi:hypothetical protein